MFAKRLFDLFLVVLTAPLWLPVLGVIALLVRWRIGTPVLFRQARAGRQGRVFEIVKFRTMTGAKDAAGNLLPDAERLTPFGQWLRSTSLDELPELWNVLKGEMSLVGPRPLLVRYLPLYSAEQRRRHDVPPGLTGWAQINGRNALDWDERFAWDIRYVDQRSLALDVRILFATVWCVFARSNVAAPGHATMAEFTGSAREGTRQ